MNHTCTGSHRLLRKIITTYVLLLGLLSPLVGHAMWEELFETHLAKARAGSPESQYQIGIMYLNGEGTDQDREQGLAWLKKASDAGYQPATSKLARVDDHESKVNDLVNLAENGDVDAQYELAMMYLKGRGVEADGELALHWLQLAADAGDTRSMTRLGIVNYDGEAGDRDYSKALSLLTKVSEDNVLAQYYLGEIYANGAGVKRDYQTAIKWYQKATDGGFNRAQGKIINLKEEIQQEKRRQQHAAAAKAAAKRTASVAVEKTVIHPAPSLFERLEKNQWLRQERPVEYLPSKVTQCEHEDGELVCFSKALSRIVGTQTVSYRVKSIIHSDKKDAITAVYRNLVIDVTDSKETGDQPSGVDDQIEQGFHIQTGWTPERVVHCELSSEQNLRCVKDQIHTFNLIAQQTSVVSE